MIVLSAECTHNMLVAHKWFVVVLLFSWNISEERKIVEFLREETPANCRPEGSYALNKCHERCECRNGKLINCYRVRKDFIKMDINQRRRFLNAYKMASTHPTLKGDYNKLVAFHIATPNDLLHSSPNIFFPWHRWFLVEFENLLRRIDCRITLPYWNWSRVADRWWSSSDDEDFWSPGDHGLGGDGNPSEYHCVEDGPFNKDQWHLLKITGGGCLTRNFSYISLTGNPEHLRRTLALPLEMFLEFEKIVRLIYHNDIHHVVGGTMYATTASNAPEVIPHHSFLDKIWHQWQKKGDDYKNVYFPSIPDKFPMLEYYGWQWLDSDNLPGGVKVTYED